MKPALRDAFEGEVAEGKRFYKEARYAEAFHKFERAHILGQRFVVPHTRTHVWMLRIGWRTRSIREILGQLIRIPGGIVGSAIGLVPIGNTGGSNVPAMKRLPIPEDLKQYLDAE